MNVYSHVANNPVNQTDPTGECPFCQAVQTLIQRFGPSLVQFLQRVPARLGECLRAASQWLGKNPTTAESAGRLTVTAGNFSQSEIRAAQELARMGYDVLLKSPTGTRSAAGSTADVLLNGLAYDLYTPLTKSADRIVSAVASKGDQAFGVIVDLSQTSVKAAELANILQRVQGAGSHIQEVILLFGK